MNQQYFALRKKNDPLNSLIGQPFNQKSKLEAEKILDEIHSKAQIRMIGKKALCYVTEKDEIKGVGGSTLLKNSKTGEIVSNLILDQFGLLLASLFSLLSTTNRSVVLKNTSAANKTINTFTNTSPFSDNSGPISLGNQLQVGSGTTVAVRVNFNIETAFGTSPESVPFNLGSSPIWNSTLGKFQSAGTISAGGSGTINETILLGQYRDSAGTAQLFALFRDIISPAVDFVVAQTITAEYTVQM